FADSQKLKSSISIESEAAVGRKASAKNWNSSRATGTAAVGRALMSDSHEITLLATARSGCEECNWPNPRARYSGSPRTTKAIRELNEQMKVVYETETDRT